MHPKIMGQTLLYYWYHTVKVVVPEEHKNSALGAKVEERAIIFVKGCFGRGIYFVEDIPEKDLPIFQGLLAVTTPLPEELPSIEDQVKVLNIWHTPTGFPTNMDFFESLDEKKTFGDILQEEPEKVFADLYIGYIRARLKEEKSNETRTSNTDLTVAFEQVRTVEIPSFMTRLRDFLAVYGLTWKE